MLLRMYMRCGIEKLNDIIMNKSAYFTHDWTIYRLRSTYSNDQSIQHSTLYYTTDRMVNIILKTVNDECVGVF